MKLFENAETQEVNVNTEEVSVQEAADQAYLKIATFMVENGIQLNSDQIDSLKNTITESVVNEGECSNCAPSSDNNQIDDKEFKTAANSQDEEVVDAAKDDSSQKGADPCPQHIEDAIEKEEKNDEFVNDYDEDVKKNESAEEDSSMYTSMLETFVLNGVQLNMDQLDALKEEFLLESKDPEKKNRKKVVNAIRKALQKDMNNEGIKMWVVESPNCKAFKKGESDKFNLKFDFQPKGLRIAAGIATAGATELGRAMGSGATAGRASQEAVSAYLEKEDEIAELVASVGKENGFEASLVRASINGFTIKAVATEAEVATENKEEE
jgi:hypothetical protein